MMSESQREPVTVDFDNWFKTSGFIEAVIELLSRISLRIDTFKDSISTNPPKSPSREDFQPPKLGLTVLENTKNSIADTVRNLREGESGTALASFNQVEELGQTLKNIPVLPHEPFANIQNLSKRFGDFFRSGDEGGYQTLEPLSIGRLPTEILLNILERLDIQSLICSTQASDELLAVFDTYSDQLTRFHGNERSDTDNIRKFLQRSIVIDHDDSEVHVAIDYTEYPQHHSFFHRKSYGDLVYAYSILTIEKILDSIMRQSCQMKSQQAADRFQMFYYAHLYAIQDYYINKDALNMISDDKFETIRKQIPSAFQKHVEGRRRYIHLPSVEKMDEVDQSFARSLVIKLLKVKILERREFSMFSRVKSLSYLGDFSSMLAQFSHNLSIYERYKIDKMNSFGLIRGKDILHNPDTFEGLIDDLRCYGAILSGFCKSIRAELQPMRAS